MRMNLNSYKLSFSIAWVHLVSKPKQTIIAMLTSEIDIGVAAIPPSAFYFNPADGAGLARFAFCKSRPTLEEAARRLLKLNKLRPK